MMTWLASATSFVTGSQVGSRSGWSLASSGTYHGCSCSYRPAATRSRMPAFTTAAGISSGRSLNCSFSSSGQTLRAMSLRPFSTALVISLGSPRYGLRTSRNDHTTSSSTTATIAFSKCCSANFLKSNFFMASFP